MERKIWQNKLLVAFRGSEGVIESGREGEREGDGGDERERG